MLLGDFQVSVHNAERPKFGAPLLLIHGLWTGPWIWRNFAGYLGHRGWSSYVVDLHGSSRDVRWENTVQALQRAVEQLDSQPVVVGHDAGALLALALHSTRAAVALAPLAPGGSASPHPILRSVRARRSRFLGRPLLPSRSQSVHLLGVSDPRLLVPEPATWADELAHIDPADLTKSAPPRLVLAAADDAIVGPAEIHRLADTIGAEFAIQKEATHALPFGPKWEALVSGVHRWIVRHLGEPLLLLRGDEDLRDD